MSISQNHRDAKGAREVRHRTSQEDANGEKMVDFWCRFFHGLVPIFSRFIRDINGDKKNISLLMIFFTVSFSRFTPSRTSSIHFHHTVPRSSSHITPRVLNILETCMFQERTFPETCVRCSTTIVSCPLRPAHARIL